MNEVKLCFQSDLETKKEIENISEELKSTLCPRHSNLIKAYEIR